MSSLLNMLIYSKLVSLMLNMLNKQTLFKILEMTFITLESTELLKQLINTIISIH